MKDRLWAMTAYFDPSGSTSRFINYQVFRARMPIPLATIELSFDGKFQLKARDADLLVQIDSGDILWQRERMVNLLAEQLPDSCDQVLIIDADAIFDNDSWVKPLQESLKPIFWFSLSDVLSVCFPISYRSPPASSMPAPGMQFSV